MKNIRIENNTYPSYCVWTKGLFAFAVLVMIVTRMR